MGISQTPHDGLTVDDLLKNADMAMYSAKNKGKNRYEFCSEPIKKAAFENMTVSNRLHRAIEQDELFVYYQPQINLSTGNIVGVEALLRWKLSDQGFIPPSVFIPIAEQTRLILPVGEWVLREACKQLSLWEKMGLDSLRLAVNISGIQITNSNIVKCVRDVLIEYAISPEQLEIEITESIALVQNPYINDTLNALKKLGVKISIDDFGKEYSSLSRLKELPFDRIKLDMCFVHGLGSNSKDEAITRSVILLAANLGVDIIAEGVETKEQFEFLRNEKCTEVQGYYLYKPMPAHDLEDILLKIKNQIN